jgi:hypothetical protein
MMFLLAASEGVKVVQDRVWKPGADDRDAVGGHRLGWVVRPPEARARGTRARDKAAWRAAVAAEGLADL